MSCSVNFQHNPICKATIQILTSERSKLPFVHKTMARTESTVFRIAYWRAPNFSQNSNRLNHPIKKKRKKKRCTLEICTVIRQCPFKICTHSSLIYEQQRTQTWVIWTTTVYPECINRYKYRDMGTRGKQRQQQQQGPVLILKVLPENRSRKALLPPNSSIIRTKTLYTTTAK